MTEKRNKRIMRLIEDIWEEHPNMRFFQLMDMLQHEYSSENKGFGKRVGYEKMSKGDENPLVFIDLFYLKDVEFEEFLRDYLKGIKVPERLFKRILDSNDRNALAKFVEDHGVNKEVIGATLLYWAVYVNKIEIVQRLLNFGANPNQYDSIGRSPLETASYYGFYEVCKLLLEYGATVTLQSISRAEDGWGENRQIDIIALLHEWKDHADEGGE